MTRRHESSTPRRGRGDENDGFPVGSPSAPIPVRAWIVLAVCSATVVLTLLDSGALFIAFPFIEEHFSGTASRATLSWVVSGFFIVMVSALLVAGRLADRFGRRRLFLVGLAVYAAGGVAAGLTDVVEVLLVARVAQGLGVACLSPSSLSIALPEFPAGRRAYALGVWGTIGAVFGLLSTPLGAFLVGWGSWRTVFFANAGVAMTVFVVAAYVLEEIPERSDRRPVDVIGAVLVTIAVAGLSLTLVQGREWGWDSPATAASLAAFVLGGSLFWLRNNASAYPLVDAHVFSNQRFAVASFSSICCQLGFFSIYFGMPLYMTEVWDWDAVEVGLGLLPFHAIPILTSVPAGRIVDQRGPRGMIAFGGLLAGSCYLVLGLLAIDRGYWWSVPTLLVGSLGAMAIGGHTTVAALHDIDDRILGAANAGYFMTRRLGSALGAVATAAIVGNRTGAEFADVFVWVAVFSATVYIAGGLATWFLYPPYEPTRADPRPTAGDMPTERPPFYDRPRKGE